MTKWIHKLGDWIGEWITQNIVIIGILLTVGVFAICILGHGRSWLLPCGATIGGCVALYQWSSDRKVKRAELLREILGKLDALNIDSLTDGIGEYGGKDGAEAELADALTFLSYVCHLKRSYVLSRREFDSLKWNIVKILEKERVFDLIRVAYQDEKRRPSDMPYYDLVMEGTANCKAGFAEAYRELLRGKKDVDIRYEEKSKVVYEERKVIDFIGSEKRYRTHLDVLNGIFNMGYRAHMRGGARLGSGEIVWFPKYVLDEKMLTDQDKRGWHNVVSENGDSIKEFWPEGECWTDDSYHRDGHVRMVFGMNMSKEGDSRSYVFLGVFKQVKKEKGYYLFERDKRRNAIDECDVRKTTGSCRN